ncbi:MAG: hypothetical protein K0S53_1367 [Bacteroidetes bacterium]|jgi:hypothetical protein|nr:hypothetical protein [Bacteroidota bacterium]MDF2450704.1 hypothetical protein [Bacteroidota bacterium]
MKKLILLSTACIFSFQSIKAQVPILEKTYEVSRKAKNGYLGNIEMNKEKETIDMIYVLPSLLPRKVKTEIYTYDKDLNLLNTVREEEWAEKLKTRWKWFNYKGDVYSTINLAASVDLTGGVVFRQKQITYYYNWYYGRYTKKVKQLEKIKAKTETDSKYAYRASYEVEADSNLLVIAGRTEKKTHKAYTHFDILSCDNKVNIKPIGTLEFKYPNGVYFSAPLKDDNEALSNDDFPRDWILIFAPIGMFKDDKDPKPTNYTYVRLSPQGQVVERFNFDSPSNGWRVLGAYEKDGSVFLYGSAITKDPTEKYIDKLYNNLQMAPTTSASQEEKDLAAAAPNGNPFGGFAAMSSTDYGATQEALDVPLDELKYTNFQIGKITNSKFDFISSPNIEEFEKKKAKPADQKKFVAFDGKKFVVNGISFTSSGDVFISGQDFVKKDNKKIYKGVYMFQFEPNGTLKKNYGVFIDQSKKKGFMSNKLLTSDMIMADNSIFESGDGKSLYWLMRSAKTVVCNTETSGGYKTETCTPLFGFDYGSINITNGELSEFKSFGDEEKREYYLFANTSSYKMGTNLFFFSETKKGDKILLTRMDLTK